MTYIDDPIRTHETMRSVYTSTTPGDRATVGSLLERLDFLAVDAEWDVPGRTALNTVVTGLCNVVPDTGLEMPNPGDTVALHLRTLGVLAARTSGADIGVEPGHAAELDRLIAQLPG